MSVQLSTMELQQPLTTATTLTIKQVLVCVDLAVTARGTLVAIRD